MRKLFVLSLLALCFVGCESNMPVLDDDSRQMLLGKWQLTKETVTNGDGFGGVSTREGNTLWTTVVYEFSDSLVEVYYHEEGISSTLDFAYRSYAYSVQQQEDGTWLLTIDGLNDRPQNLDGGRSPVTIHKLTRNSIEWEYKAYGGDEGPVGYYQYLKRIQ